MTEGRRAKERERARETDTVRETDDPVAVATTKTSVRSLLWSQFNPITKIYISPPADCFSFLWPAFEISSSAITIKVDGMLFEK